LEEEKEEPQKEFWTEMFQYLVDQKIPELEKVRETIATVEKRANISVHDYLGGGALHTPLNTKTDYLYKYYGEVNADGKAHGRGIFIWNEGLIDIGYFENGLRTGRYITRLSNGTFSVGEIYEKEGEQWKRGTWYMTDGTEKQYDYF
jgi:hypothetical protein